MGPFLTAGCLVPVLLAPSAYWFVEPRPDPDRARELVLTACSPHKPDAARRAAARALLRHHPSAVLPAILAAVEDGRPAPAPAFGYNLRADPLPTPFGLWDQAFAADWAARWGPDVDGFPAPYLEYIGPPWKRAAVGAVLAEVLPSLKAVDGRGAVVWRLRDYYSPRAEAALAAAFRDPADPVGSEAMRVLLAHHPARYAPEVVGRVADATRSAHNRRDYLAALAVTPRSALTATDRRQLIRAGFALLGEDRSYFTAGTLGKLVGADFTPDRTDPRYRDEQQNLREVFFTDTARNALAWWDAHRADYAPGR